MSEALYQKRNAILAGGVGPEMLSPGGLTISMSVSMSFNLIFCKREIIRFRRISGSESRFARLFASSFQCR